MNLITKQLLPVLAIILVAFLIAPQYVSAAEYVDKTITLEIESEYQDEHDEVVNVANESSIQNPDTWNPAPQGIWMGASTQESLFEFDVVATSSNLMKVASVVQFNRTQIMNGASEFIVRSPIAAEDLTFLQLRILMFYGAANYSIDLDLTLPDYEYADAVEVASITVDLTDVSITSGSDAWTVDGRTYLLVNCPVYAGVNYAFIWNARLVQDSSFKIYVTGQDIANDNITETRVYYRTTPMPDYDVKLHHILAIDPGISFDFLTGLGNGIYAKSYYMETNDTISFIVKTNWNPSVGYHVLMLPFGTSDGTLKANVSVEFTNYSSPSDNVWYPTRTNWTHYILASSEFPIDGFQLDVTVTIRVLEDVRVNWIFSDQPLPSLLSTTYNRAIINQSGSLHYVFSVPWCSYQQSIVPIYAPSLDMADFPTYYAPQPTDKANWYGTIIGACMIVAGAILVATGFLAPVGFVLMGTGALVIIADLAKGGHLWGGGPVSGWMTNALDKIRDALNAIGDFLISIGEGLWDAITWLVDAIIEYGSILLAILCLGVVCFLAFFIIWAQIKLWSMGLKVAKGDLEGAASEGAGVVRAVSSIASRKPPEVN